MTHFVLRCCKIYGMRPPALAASLGLLAVLFAAGLTAAKAPAKKAPPRKARAAKAPTFASMTAYLDTPPPHPRRPVRVASAAGLARAVARARAGQTIVVRGNVVVPGEFTGFNRVIRGGVVRVVFQPGVRFTGGGGPRLPAVWIRGAGGWRIWGGAISNPSGVGILVHATPGPFTWTGFTVTATADTCVAVLPAEGDVTGVTLAGTTGTAGPDLSLDPHAEKGTGIHAWNIADATGGFVRDSTFAASVVDQATGGAVQIDTSHIAGKVTVYARARHVGFGIPGTSWDGDAKAQVAGNVVQLWGSTPSGSLALRYLEGSDIRGRILETNGIESGADLSRVSVDYGRISGPILLNRGLWSRRAYALVGGIRMHFRPR